MSERPRLVLIDGHAVVYRQFFAMRGSFTTRRGEPTNALFGFSRFLLDLLQNQAPHYLAVSFDLGVGGRDILYPAYKGTRAAMPPELVVQLPRVYDLVRAFNIPILEVEGCEADDVLGTIAKQAEEQGVFTHIITGDRDILQLLTDQVHVQLPQTTGEDKIFDIAAFIEKYKITPTQFIDYKALVGDTSDNIPGVRKVGDKTATDLLLKYGTLDGVYEHLSEIKETIRNYLIEDKDMAYLSQKLATIQKDLPVQLNLESCVAQEFNPREVDKLFAEFEFRSLRDRLRAFRPFEDEEEVVVEIPVFTVDTTIVRTPEQLKALVETLNNATEIAFDTETTHVDPMLAELVGISLAIREDNGYYIPVGHIGSGMGTLFEEPAEQQLPLDVVLDALRAPLTNPNIAKIAHNATYDMLIFKNYGIEVTPVTFDTMIAEWVRDPISRFLGLKNFARQELDIRMIEISELIGTGKKQVLMSAVPIERVAPYAVADAVVTLKAKNFLQPKLAQPEIDMETLFTKMEMPMVPVIVQMEHTGTRIDTHELATQGQKLQGRILELEATIYDIAGKKFNIDSTKQLNEVLFETLKLPTVGLKKTTQGFSTDAVTLEALRNEHAVIPSLMEYRELSKLKSTYIDALPELINPKTGRIHTSYNQTGTSTGRFSSSNPNLQNIPIRTELGRDIRRAFVADVGNTLLSVDYSQIELRVMAHISGDETLRQAFLEGQDIHKATAAAVYGVALNDVTYEQRSFAKRVNFGLMYGMGAFRLARDSNLTLGEAQKFVSTYFERLPKVSEYLEKSKREAREKGYVQTLLGRKRFFPRLYRNETNSQEAQAEERAAINAPIQGTASDILKLAMLRLYQELKRVPEVKMTLQVHDELVFEVPTAQVAEIASLVTGIMQTALSDNPIMPIEFSVPLQANAEYGQNWLDMKAIGE